VEGLGLEQAEEVGVYGWTDRFHEIARQRVPPPLIGVVETKPRIESQSQGGALSSHPSEWRTNERRSSLMIAGAAVLSSSEYLSLE
jgi:hypothetical protein